MRRWILPQRPLEATGGLEKTLALMFGGGTGHDNDVGIGPSVGGRKLFESKDSRCGMGYPPVC